jgi:hypothetical protein
MRLFIFVIVAFIVAQMIGGSTPLNNSGGKMLLRKEHPVKFWIGIVFQIAFVVSLIYLEWKR